MEITVTAVPTGTSPKAPPARWWKKLVLDVPDGRCGPWEIVTKTVTKEASENSLFRALLNPDVPGMPPRFVRPGTYKQLRRYSVPMSSGKWVSVMTNTHDEILDHRVFFERARGNVLVNGLGLGLCIEALVDQVDHIWIIEYNTEVIQLVEPHYQAKYPGKVTVIHDDALQFKPADLGVHFDAVWHDIWDTISADNLPEMHKLHRKWGRYCDWQGSWVRRYCEIMREMKRATTR